MKYMKEAVEFLKKIKKTDEILIIFNNDGDGICSCTLIMNYLERSGMKKPYIISQPMPMDKNIVNKIKSTFPQKIIFLDLVVDQQEDIVKKVRGFADILIIDHHQINKNLNGKTIVHYNPRFSNKSIYQSTSYCAYKILSKVENVEKDLWIAGVGIVSDYNLEDSKDVENDVKKVYKLSGKLYDSFLGRLSDMIAAARATKVASCEEIVNIFMHMEDPELIEKNKGMEKLVHAYQEIENEKMSIMIDTKKNMCIDKNIVMYEIKSRYNLDSLISTMISETHKDKLVIVFNKNGNRYKISARNQKKNIDAGHVMKEATTGLNASGGGHEAAAGATVDVKDWEKFLEKVRELSEKK